MFDLKKRHSMVLKVASRETEEFRRVAVRRRSHTVSPGASGSYRHSGASVDPQSPPRRDQSPGTPSKPPVPPKPAHLQTPDKTARHPDLRSPSVSPAVAPRSPSANGVQTGAGSPQVVVLIQVVPAGLTPTSEGREGGRDDRRPTGSPLGRSRGTSLLAAPSADPGRAPRVGGGRRGSGGRSRAEAPASPGGAPGPARPRTPSPGLRRSGSHRLFTRSRSWVGPSRSAGARRKEPDLRPDGRSADQSERTPLTADPAVTTSPPARKKLYRTHSQTAAAGPGGPQGLPADRTPRPRVPGAGAGAGLGPAPPRGEAQAASRGDGPPEPLALTEGSTLPSEAPESVDEERRKRTTKKKARESTGEEKLFNVATELLATERAYVSRLYLLDQVFCSRLSEEASRGSFPIETVRNIFSNISSIHSFHSQFLLPDLEERMLNWWDRPGLGDVLLRHAPFLRMYAEYVGNFEPAMELLRTWRERCAAFRTVLLEIQSQDVCGSLALEHHMLEPVQRVPRYELLLKAYLGRLPEDHPDRPLAQEALDVISMAAGHSNSAIHRAERMKKLLEVFEMVGEGEVLHPCTELLREGRLLKLAARNTSATDRHLFLFNNFLLCCNPRLSLVGPRFVVRARIGVEAMQVLRTSNDEHPHSFRVSGKEKTLECEASSEKERDDWIKVIQGAIDDFHEKNETIKLASRLDGTVMEAELGRRAPRWIRDHEVDECMMCRDRFNAITRRRHHCRACGSVVCGKCSDHKAPLEYDGRRLNKVCKACYLVLSGPEPPDPRGGQRDTGTVAMASSGVMSSFLTYGVDPRSRVRVWAVVPRSRPITLRLYGAQQESSPMLVLPLLGSSVEEDPQDPQGFSLVSPASRHSFLCDGVELKRRWLVALRQAATSAGAERLPCP